MRSLTRIWGRAVESGSTVVKLRQKVIERKTPFSPTIAAGANVKSVPRMLGPKSAVMTLDVCSGLFDDDLESVAVALDEAALRAPASSNASPLR